MNHLSRSELHSEALLPSENMKSKLLKLLLSGVCMLGIGGTAFAWTLVINYNHHIHPVTHTHVYHYTVTTHTPHDHGHARFWIHKFEQVWFHSDIIKNYWLDNHIARTTTTTNTYWLYQRATDNEMRTIEW